MKRIFNNIFNAVLVLAAMAVSSCTGDLDVTPIDPNLNSEVNVNALFNKCYGSLALQGNGGANGDADVSGIDGGTTPFLRQMFNVNELPTDEAICCWGDPGIPEYNYATWNSSHPMVQGFYYRLYMGISFCNQYLTVAADHDATMTAEIRFLRCLNYYYLLDTFGNVSFSLEVTSDLPPQYTSAQLYAWLEQELLEIEPSLSAPTAKTSSSADYGRVDKAACWLLLARLYLNAQVYTGTAQWANAKTYAEKVINSAYSLSTKSVNGWTGYQLMFMGDNGENGSSCEAIFPILYQGDTTTSWGGTLFYMASTFASDMHPIRGDETTTNGTDAAWGGNRARPELVEKFFPNGAPNVASYDMIEEAGDDRAIFWGLDRTLNIEKTSEFKCGFSVAKFLNIYSTGATVGTNNTHPDADFFLMRKAEAYLIAAEADARINGGSTSSTGTGYINQLRTRAHAETKSGYTLDNILDEWAREFYFEGRRRSDLVRFGKFGGNSDYIWQYKGGTYEGRNFDSYRNIYPIPANDITNNSNLTQNPGY